MDKIRDKFAPETETVIKRILPYLMRRGYDIDKDLRFEEAVPIPGVPRTGFIDIAVHCGRPNPIFLIEGKREGSDRHDCAIRANVARRTSAFQISNDSRYAATTGLTFRADRRLFGQGAFYGQSRFIDKKS